MSTAPCHVTWWTNLHEPEGESETLASWDTLFERFAVRRPFMGDAAHPGWSPAECDPVRRGLEHVRRVFALCLDYDTGTTIGQAVERWDGTYGMVHTSRKHSDEAHRFRLILPLSRPVSPFEFAALWRRVARKAGSVDQAPKDPSRFWYVPGAPASSPFTTHRLAGAPIDVDAWLAKPEPAREEPRRVAPTPMASDVERRAEAYIDRMPAAVSGSGGHAATWNVALVLARGFALSEHATLRILRTRYNPRCEPEWSDRELEHKARGAVASERVPLGFLLEDDRAWDARRYTLPEPPREQPAPEVPPPEERAAPAQDARPVAERHGLVSMQMLMEQVWEECQKPARKPGISTGSAALDEAIGGLRPGLVTIVGAKRGWGKTSYGNLVASSAMPDRRVLMFAGEDAATIYGRRFLASRANLNAMRLRDYEYDKSDEGKILLAISQAPTQPFFVRVEGRPVEWMAQVIRDVAAEAPLDLVIVDYLQCLRTSKRTQDRRNEITHICGTLSTAIKNVNAAGLIFSQLKRGEKPEPDVEDLKESGDVEDMADHVLLGWKVERKSANGASVERKLKLGKNKDGIDAGELEAVTMRWNSRTASFEHTPAGDDWADRSESTAPRGHLRAVKGGGYTRPPSERGEFSDD